MMRFFSFRARLACGVSLALYVFSSLPGLPQTIQGPSVPIPPTLFGMTIHGAVKKTPWPAIPIGSLRLWDVVVWAQLNPGPGKYDWSRLDNVVSLYNSHGVYDMVFTFGKIPSWASKNPGSPCGSSPGLTVAIASISRKAGLVTVTTRSPLNRQPPEPIGIGGVASSSFDGGFGIASVQGPNVLTYLQEGDDEQSEGGNVYAYGGCSAGFANTENVMDFTKALTQRYCGRITNYELWNEAGIAHFTDTPAQLEQISRRQYAIIKDVSNCACDREECAPGLAGGRNPNIVIAPAVSAVEPAQLRWDSEYAGSSGMKDADVQNVHGYGFARAPEHLIAGIARIRSSGSSSLPVWDTEGCWGKNSDVPLDMQPGFVARFYIMHWLSGSSRLYWYAYDNPNLGTMWTPSGGMNAAGVAYGETYKWLVGAVLKQCSLADDHVSCNLTRPEAPGYSAHVIWSTSSQPISYEVPSGFMEYRTLDGSVHTVSTHERLRVTEPIMLENSSLK